MKNLPIAMIVCAACAAVLCGCRKKTNGTIYPPEPCPAGLEYAAAASSDIIQAPPPVPYQDAAAPQDPADKIDLKVFYAGKLDTERAADFLEFLTAHFAGTGQGEFARFKPEQAEAFDVVVLDYDGLSLQAPVPDLPTDYARATLTIGVPGADVGEKLGLKTDYLCNCLADAAHVGSLEHAVFQQPFPIQPTVEIIDAPRNYAERRLANEPEIPAQMPVWKIQETHAKSGGVVSRKYGFDDSPDAEVLVEGLNFDKEYGAVAIGRHGSVLQWGYAAPPDKMTRDGSRLFINCLVYISRFDNKGPLVRRQADHRDNALRLAALINQIRDPTFFDEIFSPALMQRFKGSPDAMVAYFLDGYELIYSDKTFMIDEQLRSLGLKSNRRMETLERLVQLLEDRLEAPTARRMLQRYTDENFQTHDDWRKWLDQNRSRIFFSDVGGYKFRIIPDEYIDRQPPLDEKK